MLEMSWNWVTIRNFIAFWLFGLCNNYGYVIMLSAAKDIIEFQNGTNRTTLNETDTCEGNITSRHCTTISTGAVLLADNLPTFIVKLTFPFFMQRIPFVFRHLLVCFLQAASYFIVAFSQNIAMSLAGVCIVSVASGIGEISYLALTSHYPPMVIAAWSSGTGGAGLIGSLAYAFLTEKSMANLSPKLALLIQLFVPIVFGLTYFCILLVPNKIHSSELPPKSSVVSVVSLETVKKCKSLGCHENDEKTGITKINTNSTDSWIPQRTLTFVEKLELIWPVLHLMIPLSLIYMTEYLINQGVTQLIIFNCSNGFQLNINAQYRWYQVLYQFGVLLSRSSITLLELSTRMLILLSVLQVTNLAFSLLEAIYWFLPNIFIVFLLIFFVGLIGGASYVNTFNRIHKTVLPDVREFTLSVASLGDSLGINIAGFVAIPLHNAICHCSMPKTRYSYDL